MKQICMRANVPFFDLSARNSTPKCSSKCRQTMDNKSHSSLSSRSVPLSQAMDSAITILLPSSSSYAGEAHFRKGDGRKGFSLLSTKMHDEQLPRVHSNEKEHHVHFYRDGGESKRGVRSVHYTKVESAIESLLSRKAALYSGSRGENKRYTGVIPLSLDAFSIPASIRNSL